MLITLRPPNPETDFPGVADLLTMAWPEPVTVEELQEEEQRQVAGKIRYRRVAVRDDGTIAGYGAAVHYPSQSAGLFHVIVAVDPEQRCQGIGAALYDDLLRFLAAQGATLLACEVPERHPQGLEFAQRRGFVIRRHAIGLILELTTFDERRFAGLVEAVTASGIRFFSLAAAGITPETLAQLYAINRTASTDDPASIDGGFPSFDVWRRLIVESAGFQPEGQILAADGETYVGLAGVHYDAETRSAESLLTGVERAYRGRKIGQALKLLSIRFALARGATHIVTQTDARNSSMIWINHKFGYQPEPGYYELVKALG